MTERKCACNKLFSTLVRGPNKEKLDSQFLQTMQVGGPNKEKLDSQFLQTMQVGVGQRNKFC
ncbi:hypothetical protein A4P28_12965, partial [Staphylococcus aureus]